LPTRGKNSTTNRDSRNNDSRINPILPSSSSSAAATAVTTTTATTATEAAIIYETSDYIDGKKLSFFQEKHFWEE